MKNPITTLHIQNFKTIKDLKVKPKRINIIIGKPNVGKSNFLEALSLPGGTYSKNENKFLSEFVRYNKFEDLFYDKETENPILIETNLNTVYLSRQSDRNQFDYFYGKTLKDIQGKIERNPDWRDKLKYNPVASLEGGVLSFLRLIIANEGNSKPLRIENWYSPVKKYEFQKGIESTNRFHEFLWPPYGDNIFTILNRNKKLLKEVSNFFKEYKLKLGLRMADTSFEVRKQVGYYVYPTEYNLIADTLQRMIFNIAAIESNKESILLFEEPEAHSFPLYAQKFANKVRESTTNQFFITTHSPFILNTIVEKTPIDEVAVSIATYEKFQTKFTEVTHKQIREMLDYGNDIFFSPQVLG